MPHASAVAHRRAKAEFGGEFADAKPRMVQRSTQAPAEVSHCRSLGQVAGQRTGQER